MYKCIKVTDSILSELKNKYPINTNDDHFKGHHIEWNKIRINKLISILGINWFKDKEILELGCGYGDIGFELKKLGAIVTFAEGQESQIPQISLRANESDIYIIDQDTEWNISKKFDLVIHWGVSYHLDKWKRDLCISLLHTKNILSFETEVLDSPDINLEIKNKEGWFEAAMNTIGTHPSVAHIEKTFKDMNVIFKRYDDIDLNCKHLTAGWTYLYDWKEGEKQEKHGADFIHGLRRFWMVTKNE
jgi:2-polyprenyl-3-methyl-5-hydroxy-6-metoxy-1,4-benzoquinol methylase